MLFSTAGQGWVFVWMLAAGALIGAWYALLAALRRLLCAGFWLSLAAATDLGAGAAVLFCGALVTADYGRVRPCWAFSCSRRGRFRRRGGWPQGLPGRCVTFSSKFAHFVGLKSYFDDRKRVKNVENKSE